MCEYGRFLAISEADRRRRTDISAQSNDAELAKHPGETPAYSVASMLRVIDGATRENAGGKFMDVSGGVNEW